MTINNNYEFERPYYDWWKKKAETHMFFLLPTLRRSKINRQGVTKDEGVKLFRRPKRFGFMQEKCRNTRISN
jgi:hypothetical protein